MTPCPQVLRCDELIAPWIVGGTVDGAAFETYIEIQLVPAVSPGDVVILDNLNVHKSPRAAQALAKCGASFLFLSKYSPDLNPIEITFSKLKTLLRKAKTRTFDDLWRAAGNICDTEIFESRSPHTHGLAAKFVC